MSQLNRKNHKDGGPVSPISEGKISYLFIMVHNIQNMLVFYCDILGFKVKYSHQDEYAFLALPDEPGPQIALYSGRKPTMEFGNHWFAVIDVNDIEYTYTYLQSLGVQVGEIENVPFGKAVKLMDPENNTIEIHERV